MNKELVKEAFGAVAELCLALDAAPLTKYPACWEHQIDSQWWIACNGHDEKKKCSREAEVDPFSIYVEFNGWPAGIFNPFGGVIAAGAAANEDTFIAAVKKATEAAQSA